MQQQNHERRFRLLTLASVLVMGSSFVVSDASAQSGTTQDSSKRAMPVSGTDAPIVDLLVVANRDEIAAGKMALENATRADVKAYAQKMVEEHLAALQMLGDSAKVGGWSHPDSATKGMMGIGARPIAVDSLTRGQDGSPAMMLHAANKTAADKLKGLPKGEFDRAYLASQAEGHAMLLKELDKHAAPNPRLQAMVVKMKASVQEHLTAVRQLQTVSASN
jgi:putative membrane protein